MEQAHTSELLNDLKIARLTLKQLAITEPKSLNAVRHIYTILAIVATALITWVMAGIYFQFK